MGDSSGGAPGSGVRGSGVVGVTGVGGCEAGAGDGAAALGDFSADIAVETRDMRDSVVATWRRFFWVVVKCFYIMN